MTDRAPNQAEAAADPAELRRTLVAIANTIGESRVLMESGEFVDLKGLDAQVAAMCEAIQRLDPTAARPLLPTLQSLVDGLDAIETVLHHQFRLQTGPDDQASRRNRAAEVYGRLAAAGNGSPPRD